LSRRSNNIRQASDGAVGVAGAVVETAVAARRPGRRPQRWAIWWLVLLQLALALIALGFALTGVTRIASWVVGGLVLLLVVIPANERWLIQRLGGTLSLRSRVREQRSRQGLAVAIGPYSVTSVPGLEGAEYGVARTASTAAIAIELRSEDMFNADPAFRLGDLAQLLTIEGIPLQAVRLLTISVPALRTGGQRPEAGLLCRTSSRYLVLSMSTEEAADELSERAGSAAGLAQLLRRASLRGCEVLEQAGLHGQPADFATMGRLVEGSLGPVHLIGASGAESWQGVTIGPTSSTTVSVGGPLEASLARLNRVIPYLPADLAVTSLIVSASAAQGFEATMLLRVSTIGPEGPPPISATRTAVLEMLGQAGLSSAAMDGEQAEALRWTIPIGVAA
jgi:hypothetical protein